MSNPTQGASAPLIKLHNQTIQGSNVECVNARDLHLFLEVGRDFSNWIKTRIKQYGFEEGADFITVFCSPKRASKGRGGHNAQDYYLTMDMAKELAMVERNEKGRQARMYFIECEKKLREESKAQGGTLPAPAQSLTPELLKFIEGRSIEVAIQAKEKATKTLIKGAASGLRHKTPEEVVEQIKSRPGVTRAYVLLWDEIDMLYAFANRLQEHCGQLQSLLDQAKS